MNQNPTSNPFNTNRIVYDSDDGKWAENRSKSLHDPLNMNMKNQSNKEVPSSSKSNVEKKKKGGRK